MLIIGHRGAAARQPENTLCAIQEGGECAHFVEVDVRLSRDGVPVIMHDPTVDRTTNGTGLVRDLTIAELRSLDAGKGEPVPTLEEVYSVVKGRCGLMVELKEKKGNEPVLDLIASAKDVPVYLVSFHPEAVRDMSGSGEHCETGLILSRMDETSLEGAVVIGASMILSKFSLLSSAVVKEAHERGLRVIPWTLNRKSEVVKAIRQNVDGVVTDDPCWAKKVLVSLK